MKKKKRELWWDERGKREEYDGEEGKKKERDKKTYEREWNFGYLMFF